MKLKIIIVVLGHLFLSMSCNTADPVNEQIRRQVEKLLIQNQLSNHCEIYCTVSVKEVYEENDFEPFWQDDHQINEFVSVIQHCEDEGLNPDDYQLSTIEILRKNKLPEARIQLDITLTDAFLLYASHLFSGKTNVLTTGAKWHIAGSDKDIAKYIFDIEKEGVLSVISEIQSRNSNYVGLKSQLKKYRSLKNDGIDWVPIDKGEIIKPGKTDKRVSAVRKRLARLGDYSIGGNMESDYYDDNLKSDVRNLQTRHGLNATGRIGDETIEELNVPVGERIKKIEVNLERLRWLPQEFSQYYVMVNIANYNLEVIKNNVVLKKFKVIVGKPFRQTPVFQSTMQSIVFNPTWTVPPTILKNDLIPAVRRNRSYLKQKNIYIYDQRGEVLNPDSIDWEDKKVYAYTYRQEPGEYNALGAVKFLFPNEYSIYLHDTPGKELFQRSQRSFSSGCIRVQNALELAEFLLMDQPQWNKKTIQKVMKSSGSKTVPLKSKPEVYLLYLTAWVTDSGQIHFREDIYNRDEVLFKALQAKPEYDIQYYI